MAILGAAAAAILLLYALGSVNGELCIGNLPTWEHAVGGRFCVINETTIVIRNFYYDGAGPDAHLYWYPDGFTSSNIPRSGNGGNFISHPNTQRDNGRFPQNGYVLNATLQFSLPEGVYACDLAVFTIWCRAANSHFTTIDIPQSLFTTDQSEAASGTILCTRTGGGGGATVFENCEQLHQDLTLDWTVNRADESVTFRLCGCTSPNDAFDNTWLGFGLSGSESATFMIGADATIVWVDREDQPHAEDYYLSAYTQCGGGTGACPDDQSSAGTCSNSAILETGFTQDGSQCVVFTRNFSAGDECDQDINPDNENQYIVWGVGGLGDTAFRHFVRAENGDAPLHLGRQPSKDCESLVCSSCDAYETQTLVAPSDATFVAHIGPSGDQRGYMGITGRAGWGIAWYINDTLIPTLVVQRGKTYTFVVYGGDDPNMNANYHPLYITNSTTGGRVFMDEQEKAVEIIYAGVEDNGSKPIGVGPLCESTSTPEADALADICEALLCNYEEALAPPSPGCKNSLADGSDNTFTWTPDDDTPDVVFYQCFTHRNLGWKIMVTDSVEDYLKSNPVRQHPDPCLSPPSPTPSEEPAVESSSPGVPSPLLLLLTSLLLLSSLAVLVR
jgi:hypothetical protein